MGKKDLALSELEAARKRAAAEFLPESKAVLYRLGMLYGELGRNTEARQVLEEYPRLTARMEDKPTLADRRQALDFLSRQ